MFWKKNKPNLKNSESLISRKYRFCSVYISTKYSQIIFIPWGKTGNGAYAEIEEISVDSWPCEFSSLQTNIEKTLNLYSEKHEYIKGNWPSYKKSKAKSQKSYESDYVFINIETDLTKPYLEMEKERITVTARPTQLDTSYKLTGTTHNIDTKVAQLVLDIFSACERIRS
ncbi:MAG: hypothetical protein KDF60_20300 [Calditrichaeota bacterium]|nr:hypothetical protein [Calditrichota bacterium]